MMQVLCHMSRSAMQDDPDDSLYFCHRHASLWDCVPVPTEDPIDEEGMHMRLDQSGSLFLENPSGPTGPRLEPAEGASR